MKEPRVADPRSKPSHGKHSGRTVSPPQPTSWSHRSAPSHASSSPFRRPESGRRPSLKTRAELTMHRFRRKSEVGLGNWTTVFFSVFFVSLCKCQGWWHFNNGLSSGEANRVRKDPKKSPWAGKPKSGKEATSGLKPVETSTQGSPEPPKPSRGRTRKGRS